MERIQEDWQHQYRATPWEYPISDNDRPATYNQFMTLRDTLVLSNKFYGDCAWRSLIIWTKLDWTPTDTIEIWKPNMSYQTFDSTGAGNPEVLGDYVATGWHTSTNPISCEIIKTWRYRLQHKEQFNNLSSSITRVHSYIVQHKADWTTQSRAVFDWEWTSAGLFKRITAYGYVECDLNKWDWLELKITDQNDNDIPLTELYGYDSCWWQVEYIDLAYN